MIFSLQRVVKRWEVTLLSSALKQQKGSKELVPVSMRKEQTLGDGLNLNESQKKTGSRTQFNPKQSKDKTRCVCE